MTREQLLEMTRRTVMGGRPQDYGSPERNFERIAALWTAHLEEVLRPDTVLLPSDVAALMILVKLARLQHNPAHMDSIVDVAGYAACWAEIVGARPVGLEGIADDAA